MKGLGLNKIAFLSMTTLMLVGSGYASARNRSVLLFSVRNFSEAANRFCTSHPGCRMIEEKTQEFSNGDTFVRVQTNLTGKRVGILIPDEMTPQMFMEALIKIRTARTLGAREIVAFLNTSISKIRVTTANGSLALPVESLIGIAGATKFVENGNHPRTIRIRRVWPGRHHLTHSFILQDSHDSIARDMGRVLNLPVYNPGSLPRGAVKGAQIIFVRPVVIPKSETFFAALARVAQMTKEGAAVTWVTPLPWARSDKADQKGVTVIGRLIADLIESVGTEAIEFARAHAPQSQGFFDIPSFNVLGLNTLCAYLRNADVEMIVSPDTGFQKDATLYADMLKLPVAVANKQRDPLTAQTKFYGFSGPSPAGKVVAIVDDETSTGGTLADVADYLKKAGATKVIAVVTHLAGDGGKALNSASIDQLVVTDSYPVSNAVVKQNSKLVIVPIGEELGRAVEDLIVKPHDKSAGDCQAILKGSQ